MSRVRIVAGHCLLGVAVLSWAVVAHADAPATSGVADVSRLSWLAGCWASVDGEPGSGEQWTPPAGGTMLGVSRTVRGGHTVAHEFVVIRVIDGAALVYVAHPSGQPAAAFHARHVGEREVVFENTAHDFPQRIGYRLGADGRRLVAWIEGTGKSGPRREEFPMTRVDCDAGTPRA
jgi:hypothetical protein